MGGLFAAGSAQACKGEPVSLNFGNSTDVRMWARASENCRFGLKIGGPNHVESVVISQAPQHGTIRQDDRSHFIYRPSSGYAGPDVIRITATGERMGNRHIWSGDIDLTYNVTVVP